MVDLRAVVHQVRETAGPAKREGLPVRLNGQIRRVNLVAVPLSTKRDHCMVLFEDTTEEPPAQRKKTTPTKGERGKRKPAGEEQEVASLRKQLSETSRDLQAIIQDWTAGVC